MPKPSFRAAAEAMPAANLNRRLALLGGMSAAAALAAIPRAHAAPMTARERFHFHLAEMKKAAIEIDPLVRFTQTAEKLGQSADWPVGILIMGQWATGRYEGDGVYAGGSTKYYSGRDRYNVKLLDTQVDGEREFSVIPVGEKDRRKWMWQSETCLEAFIGARVS